MYVIQKNSNTHIFSINLSTLTKINPAYNTNLFTSIFAGIPQIGKDCENYWLINNSLTLNNPHNAVEINLFNIFVQASRAKCNLLQIIKNQ